MTIMRVRLIVPWAAPTVALQQYFWGMVGPPFCWGFWQKRVVGHGFFVVNLWWIAGEKVVS
jgi:hypothetical protein